MNFTTKWGQELHVMHYHEIFLMEWFSYGLPGLFLVPLKDKSRPELTWAVVKIYNKINCKHSCIWQVAKDKFIFKIIYKTILHNSHDHSANTHENHCITGACRVQAIVPISVHIQKSRFNPTVQSCSTMVAWPIPGTLHYTWRGHLIVPL